MRHALPWLVVAALGAGGYGVVMAAQGDAPDGVPPDVDAPPPDGGPAPSGGGMFDRLSPFPLSPDAEIDPEAAPEGAEWSARLAAREQALTRTQRSLVEQMDRLKELQERVDRRWEEAMEARRFAEDKCGGPVVGERPQRAVLPVGEEEREARLEQVTEIVKKMDAEEAAAMMGQWGEALAVRVLERLSARIVAPLLAEMSAEEAARLTRRMATGRAEPRSPGGTP